MSPADIPPGPFRINILNTPSRCSWARAPNADMATAFIILRIYSNIRIMASVDKPAPQIPRVPAEFQESQPNSKSPGECPRRVLWTARFRRFLDGYRHLAYRHAGGGSRPPHRKRTLSGQASRPVMSTRPTATPLYSKPSSASAARKLSGSVKRMPWKPSARAASTFSGSSSMNTVWAAVRRCEASSSS